jgi:hypothetical protein
LLFCCIERGMRSGPANDSKEADMKRNRTTRKLQVEDLEHRVAPMAGIVHDPGSNEPVVGTGNGGNQPPPEPGVCGGIVSPTSAPAAGGDRRLIKRRSY